MGMTALAIIGAHIIDPATGRDATGDILIDGREIAAVGNVAVPPGARRIDASGLVAAPGFVDAGVFRPEPAACLAGGVTRLLLMPDQSPVIDDPALAERAQRIGKPHVWVHPLAAATRGLAGTELAEVGLMQAAGAVGVATGRRQVASSAVMLRLLQYAAGFGLVTVAHGEDAALADDADAVSGETATRLGLSGAPAVAEAIAIARDLRLAEAAGAHVHIHQVTTAEGIEVIRQARMRGTRVSCGTSPAYLLLNDEAVTGYRTFTRLSPPLRSEQDRRAVAAALADGTIDCLTSAHDPRTQDDKRLPFAQAAAGASGVETLLALGLSAAAGVGFPLSRLVDALSAAPARIFGLPGGRVEPGAPADVVLFDPGAPWRIDATRFLSIGDNSPFDGLPVQGKVRMTIKGGEVAFAAPDA
jgi:dihydroorotase